MAPIPKSLTRASAAPPTTFCIHHQGVSFLSLKFTVFKIKTTITRDYHIFFNNNIQQRKRPKTSKKILETSKKRLGTNENQAATKKT